MQAAGARAGQQPSAVGAEGQGGDAILNKPVAVPARARRQRQAATTFPVWRSTRTTAQERNPLAWPIASSG